MIRIAAQYDLVIDDVEALDRMSDDLMGALLLDTAVIEPDIAVSLTDREFEISFVVDTMDPHEALQVCGRVLKAAFEYAHLHHPGSGLYVQEPGLGRLPAIRSELVPA